MPTGRVSGRDVGDFDGREGEQTLARLEAAYGFFHTRRVATGGRGGVHLHFTYSGGELGSRLDGKLPGFEYKSDGRYVVVPPSRGVAGVYRYVNPGPVFALPIELFNHLRELQGGVPRAPRATAGAAPISQKQANFLAEQAVGRLAMLQPGTDNGRNNQFFRTVKELARLVQGGFLQEAFVERRLYQIAEWLEVPGACATFRSAWEDAKANPYERLPRLAQDALAIGPKPLRWIWSGYVPQGKLGIFAGDMGATKSLLTLDITSRITTGNPFPQGGDRYGPGHCLLLSAEDDPADTLIPRLLVAGADLRQISIVSMSKPEGGEPVSMTADLDRVEDEVAEKKSALLVIDPLNAYLPQTVDANADSKIRRALGPLSELANQRGVTVLVVIHLNKNVHLTKALYRVMGSVGNIAAARFGFLVAANPACPDERVLAAMKSNLGALAPSLAYRLEIEHIPAGTLDGFYPGMDQVERTKLLAQTFPRIAWGLPCAHTDRSLLQAELALERPTRRAEARKFLQKFLAGGARLKSEILDAWEAGGGKWGTLRRAAEDLGIKGVQKGNDSLWSLPQGQDTPRPEDEV
jgi:putative DNA primase/helicase